MKYVIKYEIILSDNSKIKDKEIKIDHCVSKCESQVKLEKYLIKKYSNFKQLIVISCNEDIDMNNIFKNFSDIFGGISNNPFSGFKK